jgi:putative transposase
MNRKAYSTDLTDIEWQILQPLIPLPKTGGRPRQMDMQEVVNAIFYVVRTGCAWRLLPHEFPAWSSVYGYFRRWQQDGTWEQINDTLRLAVRQQAGRQAEPSAAIMDSQSVKSSAVSGVRGYDGGKKGQWTQTTSVS